MSSSSTAPLTTPEVKVGDTLPNVVLKEGQTNYEKPIDVKLYDLIDNLDERRGNFIGRESMFKRYRQTMDILLRKTLQNTKRYDYGN